MSSSTMTTPGHPMRLIVYPLVYLLSTVLVLPVTMVIFRLAWDAVIDPYLLEINYEGDLTSYNYLAMALALFVVAVPLFGWVSMRLYRWDRTSRFSLRDHVRHSVFLYALFGVTLVMSTLSYWRDLAAGYTQPLGPGSNFVLWVTGCAIHTNLLALLWRCRRFHATSSEGTA